MEEENRRVAERLKSAERLAEDGELEAAWRRVRLALERLYTIAMLKDDPSFDPETWRDAAAEDMWNQGAGVAIEKRVTEAGPRLRDILTNTVPGAHDKTATSQTDLADAIAYLRNLLRLLRLGPG